MAIEEREKDEQLKENPNFLDLVQMETVDQLICIKFDDNWGFFYILIFLDMKWEEEEEEKRQQELKVDAGVERERLLVSARKAKVANNYQGTRL